MEKPNATTDKSNWWNVTKRDKIRKLNNLIIKDIENNDNRNALKRADDANSFKNS